MTDYSKLRKKFPAKVKRTSGKSAAVKAIAREYQMKRAQLGLSTPLNRRGFPYYMTIVTGLLIVGGLVGTAVSKRGGIDLDGKNREKAVKSVRALAVACGRFCYHTGSFPDTEAGLEALESKNIAARGWNGPYVRKINLDPWKRPYFYSYEPGDDVPVLYSNGPDGRAGTTDDIIADRRDFDEAFRDTSWTREWMPMHLRDNIVVRDEAERRAVRAEVDAILHPKIPAEGVNPLQGEWRFAMGEDASGGPTWKPAEVPHDWTAGERLGSGAAGRALACEGTGWYSRGISIPESARGKRVALVFARVAGTMEVFLDGKSVWKGDPGARTLEIDISGTAPYGRDCELLVRVDAPADAGGPFRGAGLVGDVSIAYDDPEDRIASGTLKVDTMSISKDEAKIRAVAFDGKAWTTNDFTVAQPRIWTPRRPFLYKGFLSGRLYQYAVRTMDFGHDGSFLLNGEKFALKGVRMGADMGFAGMAFSPEAARARLMALKDCGANAILFTGEGEMPEALALLCEETGFIVWDDRFDKAGDAAAASFRFDAFDTLQAGPDGSFVSGTGLCDIVFAPKRLGRACKALWIDDDPVVEILGFWNAASADGSGMAAVECATNGDEAELFVNGVSAGRVALPARNPAGDPASRIAKWNVPYEAGGIKVLAFRDGRYFGEAEAKTPFKAEAIALKPSKSALSEGETLFVEVLATDDMGERANACDMPLSVQLDGPGEIAATGNANPADGESFAGTPRPGLADGRAVLAIRRGRGGSGLPLKLKVSAAGLRSAYLSIPRR